MPKIEQWSEQLALAGRSWVVRHEAEAKIRALEAENAELLRQVNEEHDTDETLLAALITATLCRLPADCSIRRRRSRTYVQCKCVCWPAQP